MTTIPDLSCAGELDEAPPKRLVLLAFDSKEKAQAWNDAADIKEINAIRAKTTKSSAFIVEGLANWIGAG
jgi:uncharacterized protein (DUF1330 family)